MNVIEVRGVNNVLRNLTMRSLAAKKRLLEGCVKAGLRLQRASMQIVPVDTGNLRASAYTRIVDGGTITGTPEVQVGYTAEYAIYVHENPDALHGAAFNAAYAAKIAQRNAAKRGKKGVRDPGRYWHSRGRNEQYKFLETPARELRSELLGIIRKTATGR